MKPKCASLPFLLLFSIGTWGQTNMPRFDRIGREQGLSHLTTTAIYQDRQGFMWFGTIDGLNRFDGIRCRVYRADPNDPNSLASNFIHGFLEDDQGNLWVTTRNAGFSVLSPENRAAGRFRHYDVSSKGGAVAKSAVIFGFICDRNGRLWVGTDRGLATFDRQGDQFVPYSISSTGRSDGTVGHVFEDQRGTLWLTTSEGLLASVEKTPGPNEPAQGGAFRLYPHEPDDIQGADGAIVSGLFPDPQGRLWVAYHTGVLRRFDLQTKQFDLRISGFGGASPRGGRFDEAGTLWIATDGAGLAAYHFEADSLELHRHEPRRSDSLSRDNISAIYRSREGTLWIGTWGGGINRQIVDSAPIPVIRHNPLDANSPGSDFVLSILIDRGGDWWLGTSRGLSLRRAESGRWERLRDDPASPRSFPEGTIWSLIQAEDGTIWAGSQRQGIAILDPAPELSRAQFRRHQADRSDSLPSDNIKVLFQDSRGTIWAGTEDRGLAALEPADREPDRWQVFKHNPMDPASLSHNAVRCMVEDRDSSLWIGTLSAGLMRLDPTRTHFQRFPVALDGSGTTHADIRGLTIARDGTLWVATYGGGIDRRDPHSGRFENLSSGQGLANDFTYGILEDERGHLWISTNEGISNFEPRTGTVRNFTTAHGLQSDEFNTGAYARAADGTLFFGGISGFNFFHPEALRNAVQQESTQPPAVALTSLRRMGESLPVVGDTLVLAHDDKYFHFEMAVLDYRDPDANRYAYMLEGFDREWIDNEKRNYAGYTNLDPGRYRLRIRGANSRGVWNEGPPLQVRILPPFWMTPWFVLLCVVGTVIAIYAATRIRAYYKAYRGTRYVGRFELLEPLGEGGSGTVYLARDRMNRERIALKVLHSHLEESREGIRRFLQEAEVGNRLDHPNIVRIFEAGQHEGTRYISMAYLPGETLKDRIRRSGPMDEAMILTMTREILAGLAEIHARGIVHRDLKSANIMISDQDRPVIMDFGLARLSVLTTVNNRELLMGTLAYMSPEQTLSKVIDIRADIYALGVTLYEMRLGRLPFPADNEMELIYAIHNEAPRGLQSDHPLDALIACCLAKDPDQRPQNVADLLKSLDAIRK